MKYIEGRLGYNSENNRYGLLVMDLWKIQGFHCGEPLQVKIDDKWIDVTMEMKDEEWYLKCTDLKGEDLEYQIIRVEV